MFVSLPIGALVDGYEFSYGIAVAKDMATQWYDVLIVGKGIGVVLAMLIIPVPIYIKKLKQEQAIAKREQLITEKQNSGCDFVQQEIQNINSYQKAQVLTEREKNFYETIRLIAEKHNLNVSTKMRLADIVKVSEEIKKQSSLWWSKFEKISQKHIDFALQDKTNLEIKLLIEVDDYTHQRIDRIERDEFVDSVCKQANIPILHLYDVVGLEEKIVNILHSEKTEQEM